MQTMTTTESPVLHIGRSEHGHRLASRLSDDAPGPQWVPTVSGEWIEVPLDYVRAVERSAREAVAACVADGTARDEDTDSSAWSNTTLGAMDLDGAAEEIEALNDDAGCDALWPVYHRAWHAALEAD